MPFSSVPPLRWRLVFPVLVLSLLLLLRAGPLCAQAPAWQDGTSPGLGSGESTAVDGAGNTYVTGTFTGTATFGTTTLTSLGRDSDVFVAKLNSSGGYEWAVRAGGLEDDDSYDLAVDTNGNVVITGSFYGATSTFGTTTLTNASTQAHDLFVAKLTPTGVWQWATRAGGGDTDIGYGVALDGSGHVVVVGTYRSSTITFGATTLTNASAGRFDAFVARLTPEGDWQWATRAGGTTLDESLAVVLDGSGHVVVSGFFYSPTITFGTTTLTNADPTGQTADVFVAKLTPTGAWQWATRAGGSDSDYGFGVAVDRGDSVFVSGFYSSPTIAFGGTTLLGAGSQDFFVAKLSPTGAWQWAAGAGGSASEIGYAVAVDGSGSAVVTGYFASPTVTFGATTLTSAGSLDLFVAKLTPTGVWQWATRAGGSRAEGGYSVAVDGSGRVVVAGFFQSPTITFGATTLLNTTASNVSILLARLSGTTGLPETAAPARLALFPNPARTTVHLTGATGATATLLDGGGRRVRTAPVSPTGAATLEVRGLPAGHYRLRAGAATRPLVVE